MKTLLALLLLIPSLSWGNHEILICEDAYDYSFSKDHKILYINDIYGSIEASFEIVYSNDIWTIYQDLTDFERLRSFNKYSKQMVIPDYGYYDCQAFESD